MKQEIRKREGWKIPFLFLVACLPGLTGSMATVHLWLSIIPGNPEGSAIMPFVEPTQELMIQGASLFVGIPLAFILGAIAKRKAVRVAGIVFSVLPFPVGFTAFNAILVIMDYELI